MFWRASLKLLLLAGLSAPLAPCAAAEYLLAVSWQPAFCETKPRLAECRKTQHVDGFVLHGLWPQPKSRTYCGIAAALAERDRRGQWLALPSPPVSPSTRLALAQVMPGLQSGLDRHEWTKHGSCYGSDADRYFSDSVSLLRQLNQSGVARLFAGRVGQSLDRRDIRAAFDRAFGVGAGQRVRVGCQRDGNRQLITELTIGLRGPIDARSLLADLVAAAPPTGGGCPGGVVDPTGLQ